MKAKIFFGNVSMTADENFNKWIETRPNAEIRNFEYVMTKSGYHSICILYVDPDEKE